MSSNCIMCGVSIAQGILCPSCDRPRRVKFAPTAVEPMDLSLDTVSPAVASMTSILRAAAASAAIVDRDRTVKFISEDLKKIVGEIHTVRQLEEATGIPISDFTKPSLSTVTIRDRKLHVSVIPFSEGVVIVVHQVFDEPPQISEIPKVVDIVRSVTHRYVAFAELKSIRLEASLPDFADRFRHHDQLADAVGILVDNSLHYVTAGGQVVVGVRPMDHKGNPILLFFVMDNGPRVPDHMKHVIFESGFIWNAQARERTGRGLFKVREFAASHGGSVWVESRTGKACSFFLRVAADPAR
jgi:signal transduction histidine kinase